MYLRTTRRKNKDGSTVVYYQLAHNVRHPETNQPTARVIHNFGRADQLDRQQLVRLCESIARVCKLKVTDPLQASEPSPETPSVDLPESLQLVRTLELGPLLVIEALWERLGMGKTLREVAQQSGCHVPYERALLAMTANRLCEPESKLGVWNRWLEKVYLPSCQGLKLHQMYEAMDLLQEHSQQVEESIYFQTASLLNLEVDLVFYDTTTVSFSIDTEDQETKDDEALRQYGRPKDGRWSVQMVVALAVTRQGLPVRSWVFPGNTADMATVARVKRDLKGRWAIDLLASQRTKRYLTITPEAQIRLDREAIGQAARTDGKWVIQTNDDTLTPEDAACAYKSLSVIERCFRTLKRTQLKLEPVYHRLSRRLEAHVKVCVMALLIERVAELACEQPWSQLRHMLAELQATEFRTSSHLFFKQNEASSQLRKVLKKLAIPLPKGVLSVTPLSEDTPET